MDVITHNAIALHAQANKSDPFAARRIATTLRRGLDDARSVIKEAHTQIDSRRARIDADYEVYCASGARAHAMQQMFGADWQSKFAKPGPSAYMRGPKDRKYKRDRKLKKAA